MSSLNFEPWRLVGIPNDIWQQVAVQIAKFIESEKIQPAASSYTTPNQVNWAAAGLTVPQVEAAKTETRAKAGVTSREFFDIRGGMKAPHLHYKGDIYMLSETQWKRFSSMVISDFKAKLDAAGNVNFDTVMGIADFGNRL